MITCPTVIIHALYAPRTKFSRQFGIKKPVSFCTCCRWPVFSLLTPYLCIGGGRDNLHVPHKNFLALSLMLCDSQLYGSA